MCIEIDTKSEAGDGAMKLGIVGAGFIGRAVARLALANGHEAMLSNSRGPHTLTSTKVSVGCETGSVAEAAEFGDLVLVAVPFLAVHAIDPAPFAGKIVMDANNYYPERDSHIGALDAHKTTTSEIVAEHFEGAKIVKAWNAILERDIEKDARPVGAADRRALPIAGDDDDAKRIVTGFIDSLGYDVVDAGALSEGWRFERARPAYCVPLDKVGLIEALADAAMLVEEGSWRN